MLIALKVLIGNHLIDADQILRDLLNNDDKLAALCLLESRFEVMHGWELVEYFLFADTKTTVGQSFSLEVFELDRNVQATLMEVAGRFIVVEANIHLCHSLVSFETVILRLFAPVKLTIVESLGDLHEVLGCLVQSLLHILVEIFLLIEPIAWLNATRCRLICEIEEIDIRLHETLG